MLLSLAAPMVGCILAVGFFDLGVCLFREVFR